MGAEAWGAQGLSGCRTLRMRKGRPVLRTPRVEGTRNGPGSGAPGHVHIHRFRSAECRLQVVDYRVEAHQRSILIRGEHVQLVESLHEGVAQLLSHDIAAPAAAHRIRRSQPPSHVASRVGFAWGQKYQPKYKLTPCNLNARAGLCGGRTASVQVGFDGVGPRCECASRGGPRGGSEGGCSAPARAQGGAGEEEVVEWSSRLYIVGG